MNQKVMQKMAGGMVLTMFVTVLGTGAVFAQSSVTSTTTNGAGTMTPTNTVIPATTNGAVTPSDATNTVTPATTTTGSPTNTTTGTGASIPGVPNTGAGVDMLMNMLVLLASGGVAVGAAAYLARQQWKTR